jgi:antirestriction protein ArdC
LQQEPREDNAAYIANWLEVLKNDNRAIFAASAYAQRAADYINEKAAAAQVLRTCAVDSDNSVSPQGYLSSARLTAA